MFRGKKIIIFDMDGTLIDSVGIWNEVDRQLITKLMKEKISLTDEEIQGRRDDALRQFRKAENPYGEYCRILKEAYGFEETAEEIIKARYHVAQSYLRDSIEYKPGAAELLKALKAAGMTLVIASTTKRSNMEVYRQENENIRREAAIDEYFSLVYTREDVAEIKPSPEVYIRVMESLRATAEECLVFEDSLVGVEAAKCAGIQTAVIYDRYSDGEREEINRLADYTLADHREALQLLMDSRKGEKFYQK